ncbi:hypothetical protein [Jongsikchunia kroppenstedtii]|uniref:hypothetical protein n=1 Tax=Jongsikchunia kroppenstedtii TaxID=1121721 RepID=UPI0003A34B22|nr:hypothetical protein [Jongsikchunia kroppenstedtii]
MAAGAAALFTIATGAASLTPAAAAPGPVYFSAGSLNCSIADNGVVGCDLTTPAPMSIAFGSGSLYIPFNVREVLIDVPWAPAHPGLGIGTPHTLPQGNPPIDKVGHPVGSGATAGFQVERGGSSCKTGFHGAVYCDGMGHGFNYYELIQAH